MGSDKWGIGHTVSGLMPNGEKFSGEVFGYDEATGLVTVRAPGNIGGTHDVRIVKADACTDVKSIPPKTPAKTDGAMPVVDDVRSKKREEENIKAAQARAGAYAYPSRVPSTQPKTNPTNRSPDPIPDAPSLFPIKPQPTSAWASRRRRRTSSTRSPGPSRAGGRIETSWSWTRWSSRRLTSSAPASTAAIPEPCSACRKCWRTRRRSSGWREWSVRCSL